MARQSPKDKAYVRAKQLEQQPPKKNIFQKVDDFFMKRMPADFQKTHATKDSTARVRRGY